LSYRIQNANAVEFLKVLMNKDDLPDLRVLNGVLPVSEFPAWEPFMIYNSKSFTGDVDDAVFITVPENQEWILKALWISVYSGAGNFDWVDLRCFTPYVIHGTGGTPAPASDLALPLMTTADQTAFSMYNIDFPMPPKTQIDVDVDFVEGTTVVVLSGLIHRRKYV